MHRSRYLSVLGRRRPTFWPVARRTNQDYDAGRKAECLQDYDTALVHYERALRADPTNAEYKLRAAHARYEDGQFHVEQGEKALKKGDLQLALANSRRPSG